MRLMSPVHERSYSVLIFFPHFVHWKIGIQIHKVLFVRLVFLCFQVLFSTFLAGLLLLVNWVFFVEPFFCEFNNGEVRSDQ